MTGIAMNPDSEAPMITRACLCLTVIISGLALRGFGVGLGLPTLVVKYGGSMLWGTMLFFLVAIAAPSLSPRNRVGSEAGSSRFSLFTKREDLELGRNCKTRRLRCIPELAFAGRLTETSCS